MEECLRKNKLFLWHTSLPTFADSQCNHSERLPQCWERIPCKMRIVRCEYNDRDSPSIGISCVFVVLLSLWNNFLCRFSCLTGHNAVVAEELCQCQNMLRIPTNFHPWQTCKSQHRIDITTGLLYNRTWQTVISFPTLLFQVEPEIKNRHCVLCLHWDELRLLRNGLKIVLRLWPVRVQEAAMEP